MRHCFKRHVDCSEIKTQGALESLYPKLYCASELNDILLNGGQTLDVLDRLSSADSMTNDLSSQHNAIVAAT